MKTTKLTPEQVERLAPIAEKLTRAVNGGEVVGLTSTVIRNTLFPVYKEVYGDAPGNVYCAACVMRVCTRLGSLYMAAMETPSEDKTAEKAVLSHEKEVGNKTPAEKRKTPQKGKKQPKTAVKK